MMYKVVNTDIYLYPSSGCSCVEPYKFSINYNLWAAVESLTVHAGQIDDWRKPLATHYIFLFIY